MALMAASRLVWRLLASSSVPTSTGPPPPVQQQAARRALGVGRRQAPMALRQLVACDGPSLGVGRAVVLAALVVALLYAAQRVGVQLAGPWPDSVTAAIQPSTASEPTAALHVSPSSGTDASDASQGGAATVLNAAAPTLAPKGCEAWIDWRELKLTEAPHNRLGCTVFLVVDPTRLFKPIASVRRNGLRYGLAKYGSDFPYMARHIASIGTAKVYADLMGYPLYLYVMPEKPPASWSRWLKILYPRSQVLNSLFRPEYALDAVLITDLDTMHDMTENAAYSLEALESYVRRNKSIVLQGEYDVCSCVMVAHNTAFLRNSFLPRYRDECAQGYCERHSYDQLAFYAVMLDTMNGTNGRLLNGNRCRRLGYSRCQLEEISDLGQPDVAMMDWPEFTFVPQTGTLARPQLQSCMGLWGRCDKNPALVYHFGHQNYERNGQQWSLQRLKKKLRRRQCELAQLPTAECASSTLRS